MAKFGATIWMLIPVLAAVAMGFKVVNRPKGSQESPEGSATHRNIHMEMTTEELSFHFGVTQPHEVDPDGYQVVRVVGKTPEKTKRDGGHDHFLEMQAFNKRFAAPLRRNDRLLSDFSSVAVVNASGAVVRRAFNKRRDPSVASRMSLADFEDPCDHYQTDQTSIFFGYASKCGDDEYSGMLTEKNDLSNLYEISPLSKRFIDKFISESAGSGHPNHIVVRRDSAKFKEIIGHEAGDPMRHAINKRAEASFRPASWLTDKDSTKVVKRGGGKKTIEMGVFIDDVAFRIYDRYYRRDTDKIYSLVLSIMNGVQAVYHYPSLGEEIDISIVYMELQTSPKIASHGGEQGKALENFCSYQEGVMKANGAVDDDTSPHHWDTSLLISGHDFWGASRSGKRSYATMGLAAVGGICYPKWACVIGELGVKDHLEKPYPSCGFTSVFVIGHELGHNLGMSHDKLSKNGCQDNGFIMSASRGTKGEVLWSRCSADIVRKLDKPCLDEGSSSSGNADNADHTKYGNLPGLTWSPDEQCRLYMRDDAAAMNPKQPMEEICVHLTCLQTDRNGYFAAGPALEGTSCGDDKYCIGGSCVPKSWSWIQNYMKEHHGGKGSLPNPVQNAQPEWSDWSDWGDCKGDCILKSKGVKTRTRTCNVPKPVTSLSSTTCLGSPNDVQLCDFSCPAYKPADAYADGACQKFKKFSSRLNKELNGKGKQPKHLDGYPDQACLVYCQTTKTKEWYSPNVELGSEEVYFPDGTLCHEENGVDYYCRKHMCIPGSSRGGKALDERPDIPVNQNARPEDAIEGGEVDLPDSIKDFFTIDENGQRKVKAPGDGADIDNNQEFDLGDDYVPGPNTP